MRSSLEYPGSAKTAFPSGEIFAVKCGIDITKRTMAGIVRSEFFI
ncbi:hypothetical protein [Bacillus sp. YBsi01]